MPRRILALVIFGCALALQTPVTLVAADREHRQMMADIRMLQEQTQQLQALLGNLTEALKTVTAKLDEQTALNRKAFADEKLLVDNVSGDIRVVREKVDETNVRLSSLSQEVEALRLAIPQTPVSATPPVEPQTPVAGDAPPPPAPGAPANPGASPQRMYDTALSDYYAGHWTLAIQGFESYLRAFPKSDLADEAQYYIGDSYSLDSKYNEAIAAYDRVITNYPKGKMVPQAYYKRGLAYERLGQTDNARLSYELVMKNYPDSDAGRLAKQALDRLSRPVR